MGQLPTNPNPQPDSSQSQPAPPNDGFVLYREVQPFWTNHLLLVILPMESLTIGAILLATSLKASPRDQLIMLALWLTCGLALPVLLLTWRLTIEVTPTLLKAGFAGFPKWRIPLDTVERAEPKKVDPLRDLNGWGLHHNKRFGWIKNVSGNGAVTVTLTDGRKRTLGTRDPEELAGMILAGAIGEPGRAITPIRGPHAPTPKPHSVTGASNA